MKIMDTQNNLLTINEDNDQQKTIKLTINGDH